MRAAAVACVILAVLAHPVPTQAEPAEATDGVTMLTLPHPLGPGETAWIEVRLGVIARGREIEVTTASGRPLGVISPFGLRAGAEAGTYPVAVPADAIDDGKVAVRLTITQAGGPPRPPTSDEVRSVTLAIAAGAR